MMRRYQKILQQVVYGIFKKRDFSSRDIKLLGKLLLLLLFIGALNGDDDIEIVKKNTTSPVWKGTSRAKGWRLISQ